MTCNVMSKSFRSNVSRMCFLPVGGISCVQWLCDEWLPAVWGPPKDLATDVVRRHPFWPRGPPPVHGSTGRRPTLMSMWRLHFIFQIWELLCRTLVSSVCHCYLGATVPIRHACSVVATVAAPQTHNTAIVCSHGRKREILLKLESAVGQLTAETDCDF